MHLKNHAAAGGFTLIEVLVSIGVMTVGLLGVAALISATLTTGANAAYMNIGNVLASEKLDSLNKWPSYETNGVIASDGNIQPGGALTGPSSCAAGDAYCDTVTVSETSGANYETQTQIVNGTPVMTTIVHTNAGCVDTPANCGVPNPGPGGTTFLRRWMITMNPTITAASGATATVTGARRITVLVSLIGSRDPVTFQMSMVRP